MSRVKRVEKMDRFIANLQFRVPFNLEKNGDIEGIYFFSRILNPLTLMVPRINTAIMLTSLGISQLPMIKLHSYTIRIKCRSPTKVKKQTDIRLY